MRLFIITGISGSGKTSVARQLNQLGYTSLDSKINPGLFHFIDEHGQKPATNHPNDPAWKARHRWVLNQDKFNELIAGVDENQVVFLCGGGDSLKALWPSAKRVFLLQIDATTLVERLNDPHRDNLFARNEQTQRILLNRLEKYQSARKAAGAVAINAIRPLNEVINDILDQIEMTTHPSNTADQPTIRQALDAAIAFLDEQGISGARLDAELLMAYALRRDRAWIIAHDDEPLTAFQIADFEYLISRRSEHTPVVHLTGTREFYGLDIAITPDVLTPRIETEQMVEWAIKYAPQASRLIDIGTGSGAIAVAIAVHRPDLHVTATDISAKELDVARRNAHTHHTTIEFIESDLWANVSGQFDTIVTNLPYLRTDAELMPEVQREPAVALFGGTDGLDLYRQFLQGLPRHLNPGGYLFTECDPWQHEDLITEASRVGLAPIEQGYFILGFQLAK